MKRLAEKHPTYQKYLQLVERAEELGISLEFEAGTCMLKDEAFPDKEFVIKDIESGYDKVEQFPYPCEVKILTIGD